jgi:hypothetical protein
MLTRSVIPGYADGGDPESIPPIVMMDSGLALRALRNDDDVVSHAHALFFAK